MDDTIVSKGNNGDDKVAGAVALRGLDPSHPPQNILTLLQHHHFLEILLINDTNMSFLLSSDTDPDLFQNP